MTNNKLTDECLSETLKNMQDYAARDGQLSEFIGGCSAVGRVDPTFIDCVTALAELQEYRKAVNEPVARRYRYQDGRWLYKQIGDNGAGTDGYVEQLLYAAPQLSGNSEQVGWIKCSERMPDETQPVIVVTDGGVVQRTVYQFCEGVWIDWYEQYDEVSVDAFTHWQPLSAAPQQEVKQESKK